MSAPVHQRRWHVMPTEEIQQHTPSHLCWCKPYRLHIPAYMLESSEVADDVIVRHNPRNTHG